MEVKQKSIYSSSSIEEFLRQFKKPGFWKPDGTKYWRIYVGSDSIHEWIPPTRWEAPSDDSLRASIKAQDSDSTSIFWKQDGSKFWEVGGEKIYEWNVNTSWDVTTAIYNTSLGLGGIVPERIFWRPDGTMFWGAGLDNPIIQEYRVSTPWSIATTSFNKRFMDVTGLKRDENRNVRSIQGERLI